MENQLNLTEEQKLSNEIQYLNDEYRKGTQQVTDQEYDALLYKLWKLNPNHPLLQKGVIEEAPTGARKDKLPIPMYSLDKCKTLNEVFAWLVSKGVQDDEYLVLLPKYNGISILRNKNAQKVWTRGDGEWGMRCEKHFKVANSDMLEVAGLDPLVFGEMIISRFNWRKHFEGQLSPSGNPYKLNNATVAGLINQDEPTEMLKYVEFVPYGMANSDLSEKDKHDQLLELQYARSASNKLGVEYYPMTVKELRDNPGSVDGLFKRWNKDFPCDGLVIEIDSAEIRNRLGRETNMNPAYARALKLSKWSESMDTVIVGYDKQISKQGKLKGVTKIVPVVIDGTDVKQATFYNAKFLLDWGLFPGVEITIKKSGDIIPKISSVGGVFIPLREDFANEREYNEAYLLAQEEVSQYRKDNSIVMPLDMYRCPSCGSELNWNDTNTELVCDNKHCESMLISKLEHFFTTMLVEEFGRPSIETVYKAGYKTVFEIMTKYKEFSNLPGMGEGTVAVIDEQFKKIISTKQPLARVLTAFDLFEGKIGEKLVQNIFDNYVYSPGSSPFNLEFNLSGLMKIKGVSDITAKVFINGLEAFKEMLSIEEFQTWFYDTFDAYRNSPKQEPTGNKLLGTSICFSGIRDKELEDVITSEGGKIASGVSKTTTHLIVADLNQSTSKTEAARKFGMPIHTIESFKELISK